MRRTAALQFWQEFRRWVTLVSIVLAGCGEAGPSVALERTTATQPIFEARYFGMHVHRPESTEWPHTAFGTWRLWDAGISWADMEPTAGRYDFSKLDRYLDLAARKKVDVVLPIALTPRWVSSRPAEASAYGPGKAAPPSDMGSWERFTKKLVQHTRGRVRAYELWNEANIPAFYTGGMPTLVEMARLLHVAVRTYAPEALIVGPSGAGLLDQRRKFLAQFVAAGGGRWVDVLSFHLYTGPHPPEVMVAAVEELRAVAATAAGDGTGLPLWNTESGYQVRPGNGARGSSHQDALPPGLAAAYMVRAHIIARALGVEQFDSYAWDNSSYPHTLDDQRTMNEVGVAHAAMTSLLIGVKLQECSIQRRGVCVCTLLSPELGEFNLAWSSTDSPTNWNPGRTVRVRTLNGTVLDGVTGNVTLSAMPVVVTPPQAATKQ